MIGNEKTVYVQLGANNHSEKEREKDDFYSTDPNSLEIFLKALERDNVKLHSDIWECACGKGDLSKLLEERGYNVYSSDLVYRGYGIGNKDFMKSEKYMWGGDILTNPPFKIATDFVSKALEIARPGKYVIMYLKIQFLEGKERLKLFKKYPPKYVYVNSQRQLCYLGGDTNNKMSSAICYCWFIWEKGCNDEPIIRWI